MLALDARRRVVLPELESLRAAKNDASEAIAAAKRAGQDTAAAIARMREVGEREKQLEQELATVQGELDAALFSLPNLPSSDAADADTVIRSVGEPRSTPAADHLELAGPLIDMEAGARLSGARFAYLKGDLVMLELALVRWALERLRAQGFEPVIPPVLVREQALFGTGFLPDTEQQLYRLADDELFLAGTSEVALASLHAGEILDVEALPLRYAGFSSCFRREAGAAGKDTRGIFRVHQFDKVEMFVFTERRAGDRGARADPRDRGVAAGRAADPLSRGQHRGRRSRLLGGQEVRLRSVAPRPGPLPRADLVLEHDRLPGAPARDPCASCRRAAHRGPHPQRHRGRRGSHDRRTARESSARRSLGRRAAVPGGVRRTRR